MGRLDGWSDTRSSRIKPCSRQLEATGFSRAPSLTYVLTCAFCNAMVLHMAITRRTAYVPVVPSCCAGLGWAGEGYAVPIGQRVADFFAVTQKKKQVFYQAAKRKIDATDFAKHPPRH